MRTLYNERKRKIKITARSRRDDRIFDDLENQYYKGKEKVEKMKLEVIGKIIRCGNDENGESRIIIQTENGKEIVAQLPIENVIESFSNIFKSVKVSIETIETRDSGIRVSRKKRVI